MTRWEGHQRDNRSIVPLYVNIEVKKYQYGCVTNKERKKRMGYFAAKDMLNQTANIDEVLSWHFQSNCYPPVPLHMIEPAKQAIDACNQGDPGEKIDMGDTGIYHRVYGTLVPAEVIIEQLRLEAFLES